MGGVGGFGREKEGEVEGGKSGKRRKRNEKFMKEEEGGWMNEELGGWFDE